MKALSIRQPLAWAILHAGKRVENRQWRAAPRAMIGQTFLHPAAAGCTRTEYDDAVRFMAERGLVNTTGCYGGRTGAPMMPWLSAGELPRGALVGRARLVEAVLTVDHQRHRVTPGKRGPCLLCGDSPEQTAGTFTWRFGCPKADPWAVPRALGLVLSDVEPLPDPIPFKGALGFFEVPEEALR